MGTHMKTTIDIADGLLDQARERARAEGRTLRAVIEEGLRRVLEGPPPAEYRYEPVVFGDPDHPIDPDDLRRALDDARAETRDPEGLEPA